LTGLKNRKTNDIYTRLHEDSQVYFKQIIQKYREHQLEKNGKKVKSNSLVLEEQQKLIEKFTGDSYLCHLKKLFKIYMGTGHVIDAFRILKTIGSCYPKNLYVKFEIFRFYLEIGNLRKAESFLLCVISPLKISPWHLTIYSMLLYQMKKYKEALIIYRVS
jgi:predicted Zn-dependent protease